MATLFKTYSHESAFSTATGPKVIYKGDTAKSKLHLRLILVGETKAIPILDTLKEKKLRMQPSSFLCMGRKTPRYCRANHERWTRNR